LKGGAFDYEGGEKGRPVKRVLGGCAVLSLHERKGRRGN